MNHTTRSFIPHAADSLAVDIECRITTGLPAVVIVGGANRTVAEARERLRGAFNASGLRLPPRRVSLNLAPAELAKASSGLDLALAIAILTADNRLPAPPQPDEAFVGELGLDGLLRPVRGIVGLLLGGRAGGTKRFFVAAPDLPQAALVPGVEIVAAASLRQVYEHLSGLALLPVHTTGAGWPAKRAATEDPFQDIAGHEQAKRALVIAAAGGHNLLLCGPPGTGKTMLARALTGLLPPLSHTELLQVTHLHSLVGKGALRPQAAPPLRAPHHTASVSSLIGGSRGLPGEVSLSNHGVLLFDELPEFSRPALESLRQPLEDRTISVTRSGGSVTYPADFTFVATANPCPCGYLGEQTGRCGCTMGDINRYRRKLSGPLLDRIDMTVYVPAQPPGTLLQAPASDTGTTAARHVARARRCQRRRYGPGRLNRDLSSKQLARTAALSVEAGQLLDTAATNLQLSARSYLRTAKVARTIADLEGAESVGPAHLAEALQYRPQSVLPGQPGATS